MPSDVEISNVALSLLGERKLLTAFDGSGNSDLCQITFERVYKALQRIYPWKTLKTKAVLAASTTTPLFGRENSFPLPNDCAKLVQVYDGETGVTSHPWELVGNNIETNIAAPLRILYIKYSANPDEWDTMLQDAVAYRMAGDMAESITNDGNKKASLYSAYDVVMKEARMADSQEQQSKNIGINSWDSSRYTGSAAIADPRT